MTSLNTYALESNTYIKLNFDGGNLFSDSALLLIKEFTQKLGFTKLLKGEFETTDTASSHAHKNDENLWQVIYQIYGAYFQDDCADELINDPVLKAILGKEALDSQQTLSRFFNCMDDATHLQFYEIMHKM